MLCIIIMWYMILSLRSLWWAFPGSGSRQLIRIFLQHGAADHLILNLAAFEQKGCFLVKSFVGVGFSPVMMLVS